MTEINSAGDESVRCQNQPLQSEPNFTLIKIHDASAVSDGEMRGGGVQREGFPDCSFLLHSNVSPIPSPPPASSLRGRERAAANKSRRFHLDLFQSSLRAETLMMHFILHGLFAQALHPGALYPQSVDEQRCRGDGRSGQEVGT